mmetsp:Transcript_3643/g.5340  ORF Transcript_3643/g.5340 Transcript_3643/m.5340 type:complete len:354 (+) Transcript_3643:429-1490(+)
MTPSQTCMDPPESSHQRCIRPKFDGVGLTPAPVIPTPTRSPTVSPTPNPTASPAVITPVPLPTMPIWTFLPFPRGTPIPSQPLQISTPIPSVSSSITSQSEFCDDDRFAKFFVAETGKEEPCVWLAARPEYIPSLCGEGQEAREKCPESCRVCTDDCEDSTNKFDLDGGKRNCIFLSLRNNLIDQYCVEGTDVYDACPETCDKCDSQVRTAGPPPSSLPQSSNPIPITPIPTTHPTSDPPVPTEGIRCDDDRTTKFWVPSLEKYEPCVWLSARPEEKIILCQPGQEAYRICPETCGVCSDSCEDTDGRFDLNEVSRDCLWLSLRNSVINEVCQPGNEAYSVCPETCDACDTSQ